MKKTLYIIIGGILVLAAAAAIYLFAVPRQPEPARTEQAPATSVDVGPVSRIVGATGTVTSNQSALLTWKTSGTISQVNPRLGDQVQAGDVLAVIDPDSLSPADILARAELVAAEKALEYLQESRVQSARALQAVDAARQELAEARDPDLDQSAALQAVAEAEKSVAEAGRKLKIITNPVSQSALDQARANLVLAEVKLADNQEQIDRIQKKLDKRDDQYKPWESRRRYKKILEGLELQRIQLQIAYENSRQKYQNLQDPPNPVDVALAEAELLAAQATLDEAARDWARIQDGTSPADLALLEARLADAQREWQRLKDGPTQEDIAVAQARVTAAKAAIENARILAPFSGTITEIHSQPNDRVSPGTPAFRLDDLSSLQVDVGVSEIDINLVKIGQPVILTFDAVLDRQYSGQVVEVSPVGSLNQGIVDFKVRVELTDADAAIRPGMTAAVEIIIQETDQAGLVPLNTWSAASHLCLDRQDAQMQLFEAFVCASPIDST